MCHFEGRNRGANRDRVKAKEPMTEYDWVFRGRIYVNHTSENERDDPRLRSRHIFSVFEPALLRPKVRDLPRLANYGYSPCCHSESATSLVLQRC